MKNLSVVDFLSRHENYVYNLEEHIKSIEFIAVANNRFLNFCASSFKDIKNPWEDHFETIKRLFSKIPAYRIHDFTKKVNSNTLSTTTKEQLKLNTDSYTNPLECSDYQWLRPTSGTTGVPFNSLYSGEFHFYYKYYSVARAAFFGGKLDEDLLNSDVFCVSITSDRTLKPLVWDIPNNYFGLVVRPVLDTRQQSAIDELIELLTIYNPSVIALMPRSLEYILNHNSSALKQAFSNVKMIVSSASDLEVETQASAYEVLHTEVFNCYGLSEIGVVATECKMHDGLHIFEHDALVEVQTDNGSIKLTGKGQIIATSLINGAMPLLRYETGDYGEIIKEPCVCGLPGRRIKNLSGRLIKNLKLPNNTELSPTYFKKLQKIFPIKEFRLTQTRADTLLVEIEYLNESSSLDCPPKRIRDYFRRELNDLLKIDLQTVQFDYSLKFQRYRSYI